MSLIILPKDFTRVNAEIPIQLWFVDIKCSDCNKSYEKGFDEDLVKKFDKTYRFQDGDINSV